MFFVVSNLIVCSGDGRPLLKDISWAQEPGSAVVLWGPSGSGKTTLLRTLAWLHPPSGGHVALRGQTPADLGIPQWRANLCYVPQSVPPLPGSPADLARAQARFKAQRTRTREDPQRFANLWGLPRRSWHKDWAELSGGEQQRALLAIALAAQPSILLLDEPTSALDHDTARCVESSLAHTTTVVATHAADQVERLDARRIDLSAHATT